MVHNLEEEKKCQKHYPTVMTDLRTKEYEEFFLVAEKIATLINMSMPAIAISRI